MIVSKHNQSLQLTIDPAGAVVAARTLLASTAAEHQR